MLDKLEQVRGQEEEEEEKRSLERQTSECSFMAAHSLCPFSRT